MKFILSICRMMRSFCLPSRTIHQVHCSIHPSAGRVHREHSVQVPAAHITNKVLPLHPARLSSPTLTIIMSRTLVASRKLLSLWMTACASLFCASAFVAALNHENARPVLLVPGLVQIRVRWDQPLLVLNIGSCWHPDRTFSHNWRPRL